MKFEQFPILILVSLIVLSIPVLPIQASSTPMGPLWGWTQMTMVNFGATTGTYSYDSGAGHYKAKEGLVNQVYRFERNWKTQYKIPNDPYYVRNVRARVWIERISTYDEQLVVKIYTSSDGSSWTLIDTNVESPPTTGTWFYYNQDASDCR